MLLRVKYLHTYSEGVIEGLTSSLSNFDGMVRSQTGFSPCLNQVQPLVLALRGVAAITMYDASLSDSGYGTYMESNTFLAAYGTVDVLL